MGKSTLVNHISNAIPELHVCREGDYSPIDLAWCTWMSEQEYETVLKKYNLIQDEIVKNTIRRAGALYYFLYEDNYRFTGVS